LDERVKSVEERLNGVLTRDEFLSRTDELLTELRTLRDEYLILTRRVYGHEDRIAALETIHPSGQHAESKLP